MAKTTVVWDGLEELKALLAQLPETMTGEAARLAESSANSAAVDIRSGYLQAVTSRSGKLVNSVQVQPLTRGTGRTGYRVRVGSFLANIFEGDHKPRTTSKGWPRGTISTPSHIVIPRIIKWRRRMIEVLKISLIRHGASRVSE